MLRDAHNLDDNATKVLIVAKLKGKALNWFHSKPEHIQLSTTDLLTQMREMFDHRPSQLSLKKEFERRTWQISETFNNYCHEKVILGNKVPIPANEIVDYIVEGVPDTRLQDQARMQCFSSIAQLMKAFEKISLKGNTRYGRDNKNGTTTKEIAKDPKTMKEPLEGRTEPARSTRRGTIRCFNCRGMGHRAADCRKPKVVTDQQPASQNGNAKETPSLNLIHRSTDPDPYVVNMCYMITDDQGKAQENCIKAIVDSGSPISLIKPGFVSKNCLHPVEEAHQYTGVNKSPIELRETFEKGIRIENIEVDVKFFVVPDTTMNFAALLGRNFISNPEIKVEFNDTVRISRRAIAADGDRHIEQILNIEYVDSRRDELDLKIESSVSNEIKEKLKRVYTKSYLTEDKSTLPICVPEMTICLKHEQPITFRAR